VLCLSRAAVRPVGSCAPCLLQSLTSLLEASAVYRNLAMDSERYDTITKNTNSFSDIDAEPYSTSGLTIYNNSSNVNNIIGSGTIINNNQIINNLVFKDVLNELVHSPAQSVLL